MNTDKLTLYAIDSTLAEFTGADLGAVADLLETFADSLPALHGDKLRSIARELLLCEVNQDDDLSELREVDLADVVVGETERVVVWEQFLGMLDDLADDGLCSKAAEAWTELVQLLTDRRIAYEPGDETKLPPTQVVAVGATCVANLTPPTGWKYEAQLYGVVIKRNDDLAYIQPLDPYGRKFRAFTRRDKITVDGGFKPVRDAKGKLRTFTYLSEAVRAANAVG